MEPPVPVVEDIAKSYPTIVASGTYEQLLENPFATYQWYKKYAICASTEEFPEVVRVVTMCYICVIMT